MATAKRKMKGKEISIKVKHGVFWILVGIAVVIFISGVTFYKVGDKFSFYKSISSIGRNEISTCMDISCVVQKVNTNPYITEDDCSESPYEEVCLNTLYKKQALSSGDKNKCTSISNEHERNSCYMSLSLSYNNPAYCQYITESALKQMCLNAISGQE